jgi:SAM-dependent methyltransferase
MSALDELSPQAQDYRAVHLEKGGQYDASLAESPWDAYMAHWERKRLPELLRRFIPAGPQRYLDFACGTGRVTEQVAPLAKHSVGVDISPTMVQEAKRKCPQTQFHIVDLTTQDPDLGQFDLITSFRFFGNAQDDLREGALRGISRRLATGGHLVINSHRNPRALYARLERWTGGGAEMDLHLPKLRALLARHGLDIVALQPIGAWMFRSSLMLSTKPDDARALKNEARFASPMLAGISPDLIVVAKKR